MIVLERIERLLVAENSLPIQSEAIAAFRLCGPPPE